jgi:transcription initiation factor IIE alpha subunit
MTESEIRTAVIKALIAKGELTDERLAEVLGEGYEWDGEMVLDVLEE